MDLRKYEASSTGTIDSFIRNIRNNWDQKTEVEGLQSARYQGDLEAVTDRIDQLKMTEEGKKIVNQKQQ